MFRRNKKMMIYTSNLKLNPLQQHDRQSVVVRNSEICLSITVKCLLSSLFFFSSSFSRRNTVSTESITYLHLKILKMSRCVVLSFQTENSFVKCFI